MKKSISILSVLLAVSLIAFASRRVTAPTKSDLVGIWLGYEASFVDFYRLNLRDDNSGTMVIVYPEGNSRIYDVRWEINKARLLIEPSQRSADAEKIVCSVTKVDYRHVELVIAGASRQWKRTAVLLNEKELSAKTTESASYERKHTPQR